MRADFHDSHATPSLRPLCPTRWVVRAKSIQSVLNNYEALMHAMEEVSFASDDAGAKANGFLKWLQSFEMLFGLQVSLAVLEHTKSCNATLQSPKTSVAHAKCAAQIAADMITQHVKETCCAQRGKPANECSPLRSDEY